ncbi:MAG TPA: cache domain-containing protein [Holophagaceae bacterium]|nr:cache domain-containing protein [Holophagaceae bacterium]
MTPPRRPLLGIFRTVRGRLVLLACLATLPAFLFVLVVAAQERGAALRQAEHESRYVAGLASREHALQVLGTEQLLRRLAREDSAEGSPETLERTLPVVLSAFPQVANLGILEADGRLRFSVVPPAHPVDMSDNPAFQAALASSEVALGRYQMGQIVGRPILILAQALRGKEGRVRGVLFAALDLGWLDQLARQARLPQDYALLITDREGRVLARSEGAGPRVAQVGERVPAFDSLLRAGQGLVRGVGSDGVPRLFTASALDGVPDLFVAVGLPEEQVVGQANRAFTRAVVALVVLTLLTVASSIAAADLSVLREARQLAKATRSFGTGDLTARAPVPAAQGEIQDLALAFNTMADALERRHHEALQAQDQLRALSHRVEAAREEESARISRELHDQLGQELTALKLDLAQVKRKLQPGGTAAGVVGEALDQMAGQIDRCVDSVRRISSELRPSVLDRLGLGPALEWLAREFERRTGLPCVVDGCDPPGDIDPASATALFRIAQEALTNVIRHAEAHSAVLSFLQEGEELVLSIQDDGVGFECAADGGSLGLLGMRERARLVGGVLTFETAPGRGTRVEARIPRREGD